MIDAKRMSNPNSINPNLIAALRDLFGDALLTDPGECLAYGYDNSRRRATPAAVVLPDNADQLQRLVQLCREHQMPITARGRGTNTTGASVPVEGGVVVSFERMNRILRISPDDRVAVVEPGVLNGDLQTALSEHGLFWPPDPTSAPYSSVGGNLACNAGGPRAVRWGSSRDNVLGLVAITGCGERIRCGAPTSKDSTGYDLSRLVVGSEGTLALIVEASLKLSAKPESRRSLRALYRDTESAARAVGQLMIQAELPSALEFMDAEAVRLARERGGADIPDAGALLMIEVESAEGAVDAARDALETAARNDGLIAIDRADDAQQRESLWAARRALSPALRSVAPGKINEDVVVPVSRLAELVTRLQIFAQRHDTHVVSFGHAGNGNLHVNLLHDPADTAQTQRALACLDDVFATVIELGGTLSGEHGIGLAKRDWMARAFDADTLATMRRVKAAFDPDGILNPGKVLPPADSAT
ncbi:MAG: FAD-linked oxidase C-terminal domain-containing protein [Lysobacteraceae bacterium]